jgi:hypothetical protein
MNTPIVAGSKVKFIGQFGHAGEIAEGYRLLKADTEYTVNYVHTPNPFNTFLFLDGVPGHGFNMVMFEPVEVVECISH